MFSCEICKNFKYISEKLLLYSGAVSWRCSMVKLFEFIVYYSPESIFNSFFLQYTEIHGVVFNSRCVTLLKRNTIAGAPLSILQYFSEKLFYRTSVNSCKMVISCTLRDSRLEIYKQKSVFWSFNLCGNGLLWNVSDHIFKDLGNQSCFCHDFMSCLLFLRLWNGLKWGFSQNFGKYHENIFSGVLLSA